MEWKMAEFEDALDNGTMLIQCSSVAVIKELKPTLQSRSLKKDKNQIHNYKPIAKNGAHVQINIIPSKRVR